MANAFETGFLRDTTTHILACTTDATGAEWGTGFLRSPSGELVVTTDTTGATWQEGFLRAANGALVVEQDAAGSFETGFVRASSGALDVSQNSDGSDRASGFIRTASGLLVVTGLVDYSALVLADSPTSYWRLNESSGTTAADEQGLNDGTYVNTPTLGAAALAPGGGTAVEFVAANSEELTLPGPSLTTTCSIEFWFKWTAGIALMRDATQAAGWIIGFDSSGSFHCRVAGTSEIITSLATADVRDGNRHHLVLSKAGASTIVYVDGVNVGSNGASASTANTGSWHVARNGTAPSQYTDCVIDELAIYPTALTAGQVNTHFTGGA